MAGELAQGGNKRGNVLPRPIRVAHDPVAREARPVRQIAVDVDRHTVERQPVKGVGVRKQLFGGDLADLEPAHNALHGPRRGECCRRHNRSKRHWQRAHHLNTLGFP